MLLLVDARAGRTAGDEEIMQRLRVLGAEVLLVINKIDGIAPETAEAEFLVFGVADHALVSANHGRGIAGLATAVAAHLATSRPVTETAPLPYVAGRVRLAVIGRPNVGKSTLINRWLGETRQVVFDAPGTTRDSIEIPLQHAVGDFLLVDTAGVRRKGRVDGVVEKFSVVKALQAMREADVAVLVIDAQEGLVDQDLHLFEFAADVGTGLVLAVNKWDGLSADTRASVKVGLDRRLTFAPWVPLRFISALHGTGVPDVLREVLRVHRCADFDVQTPVLTRILNDAVRAHPPPSVSGRRIKLRYAHKTGGHPPTVMIHGNQTNAVPASYTRFLENRFRKALKLIRKAKAGEMPGTLNLKKAVAPPRIQRVTVASKARARESARTLDLKGAAALLHIHPETLRQRARTGEIPGAKLGRSWVFIEEDLLEYIRDRYAKHASGASDNRGGTLCRSTVEAMASGISTTRPGAVDPEYANLLSLKTNGLQRNCTTR